VTSDGKTLIYASGGARVFAARGKRLCCHPHPRNQISNWYSYGYNDGISVDCKQYAKLQCKRQFARRGQISEFHIFAPPNAAPCTVPLRADAHLSPPSRRHWYMPTVAVRLQDMSENCSATKTAVTQKQPKFSVQNFSPFFTRFFSRPIYFANITKFC